MIKSFGDISSQVSINDGGKVRCRDVWQFLGVKTKYRHWVDRRISDLGLEKGNDFSEVIFDRLAGSPKVDHEVSVDTAKEMAMLERNDRGRELRRYFIAAESKLREVQSLSKSTLQPPVQSLDAKLESMEKAVGRLDEIYKVVERHPAFVKDAIYDFIEGNVGIDLKPKNRACSLELAPSLKDIQISLPKPAGKGSEWMIPTKLGEYLHTSLGADELSPQQVNQLLIKAGLQKGSGPRGGGPYTATSKGEAISTLAPVTVTSWRGTSRKSQILWDRDKTAEILIDQI